MLNENIYIVYDTLYAAYIVGQLHWYIDSAV